MTVRNAQRPSFCFAYKDVAAASRLIGVALNYALRSGFPAVFVSVAEPTRQHFQAALNQFVFIPRRSRVWDWT